MVKQTFFILFGLVFVIVSFISGVKYGRSIEFDESLLKTLAKIESDLNKEADPNYSFSSFKMIDLKNCDLKILVPDEADISAKEEAAIVSFNNKELFQITCFKVEHNLNIKTNTEISFNSAVVPAGDFGEFVIFSYKHPNKNIWYQFKADKKVFPLLNAVEFL
ncbi:MAG: hypothetical protein KatS3mg091_279 [Patescibacteria group bacterium]|nr:MAG: hypothetical protein KatS3mg091_279 [Patescibacteria group bacterium]